MTSTSKELSGITPGPWKVAKFIGDGKPQLEISSDASAFWIAGVGTAATPSGEGWANAYLIAAAPDLLDALKALISHPPVLEALAPRESLGSLLAQAEAAIAKAERLSQ